MTSPIVTYHLGAPKAILNPGNADVVWSWITHQSPSRGILPQTTAPQSTMILQGFNSEKDVLSQFGADPSALDSLTIVFAAYHQESYEGEALVLLIDDALNLFEVNGSHCSCHGLEGMWDPEPTTIEALKKRNSEFFNAEVMQHLDSLYTHKVLTDITEEAYQDAPKAFKKM